MGITILLSYLGKCRHSPAARWVAHSSLLPDSTRLPRKAAHTETRLQQRALEVSLLGRGTGEAILETRTVMQMGLGGSQIAKAFRLHWLFPAGPMSWASVHRSDCHGRGGGRWSQRQEPPSPMSSLRLLCGLIKLLKEEEGTGER